MALQKIHFISLFPDVIRDGLSHSLIGKAGDKITLNFIQLRDFAKNKHKTVDDTPSGGGAGMLLKPDVLFDAWSSVTSLEEKRLRPAAERPYTILLSPQGKLLAQSKAKTMASHHRELIIVTGHYEGVDERFIDLCVDEEMSIGDYVLTGGEFAALVVADVLIRLIPGVVGSEESVARDSLENGLLKAPQYTRPREFQGLTVPDVLLGGNHAAIEKWRSEQSQARTKRKRPDLWEALKKTKQ
ncbi:MAG: tRNA (guanosine(37)-N1)-methyltransferase TrmD [Bdellovibrionales bacterium]|nr:tRNA (guanosine(37)-N1)-methyltransferase TrmD [Bdellovibrionales bacterium]